MGGRELAGEICRTLRASGHQAYLVGGCVRDLLLGREPEDYDVATDAHPGRVQELFPGSVDVGTRFGVMLVLEPGVLEQGILEPGVLEPGAVEDGAPATTEERGLSSGANAEDHAIKPEKKRAQVEVATFRSDLGYSDGRHPDRVEYSRTPEEDVRRRDFTINGLMMDPETHEVLDFVGGRADLEAKIVRAIGDPVVRFREDKLRMVRAVRFAARFGYTIEPATLAAIRALAPQITEVSAERLRDELTKLLTEGAARRAFELLDETGLLQVLLPEVARMKGVEQPPQYHPEGDVWIHTRLMIEGLEPRSAATLAWGVLLHDVGKPPTFRPVAETGDRIRFDGHAEIGSKMAEAICERLRFSTDETEQIESLVGNHMRFKDVQGMRPATLKRLVRLPRFEQHLELHRLDCVSSHRMLDNYNYVRRFLAETPPEEVRPPRLVTGDDLREMGFRPGPEFKTILQAVEDAQLDGRLRGKEEALAFIRSNYRI